MEQAIEEKQGLALYTDPAVCGIVDPVSLSDLPSKFFYHIYIYIRKQTRQWKKCRGELILAIKYFLWLAYLLIS